MIVFSVIALIYYIAFVARYGSYLGYVSYFYKGIVGAIVFSFISAIIELLAGIIGIKSHNKGLLFKVGIVVCVLALVAFIINCATSGFNVINLLVFIFPILYTAGAYKSIQ